MKTVVIGDLHLEDKYPGYLDSQMDSILRIVDFHYPCTVVFLGDIFHFRKPTPTTLLEAQAFFLRLRGSCFGISIVRGNHDSESKADDGVTVLSLFSSSELKVYTEIESYDNTHFIPHYENEETIQEYLTCLTDNSVVFGHFGFSTCVNSTGSYDFSIPLSNLRGLTFLGHIHKFSRKGSVYVLGTPFTTSFRESGQDKFYAVLERGLESDHRRSGRLEVEILPNTTGPVYIECTPEEVSDYAEVFVDTKCFVCLKVFVEKLALVNASEVKSVIAEEYPNIKHIEISYKPLILDEDNLSEFSTDEKIFSITDDLIKDYVNQSNTLFTEEELFSLLDDIRNETDTV